MYKVTSTNVNWKVIMYDSTAYCVTFLCSLSVNFSGLFYTGLHNALSLVIARVNILLLTLGDSIVIIRHVSYYIVTGRCPFQYHLVQYSSRMWRPYCVCSNCRMKGSLVVVCWRLLILYQLLQKHKLVSETTFSHKQCKFGVTKSLATLFK